MKLLIVEDYPVQRDLLAQAFRLLGYEAVTVGTAVQALRELDRGGIDAVILDIGLPGVSGASFLAAIREDARFKGLPVVVTTGADPEWVRFLKYVPLVRVLHKPDTTPAEIEPCLADMMGADKLPKRKNG